MQLTELATRLAPLPGTQAIRLIDESGSVVPCDDFALPEAGVLRELYRAMVTGRRFDRQATALTKQGRLAVYPSSAGQDACQVASVLALEPQDWLFPTYRDTMALITRGVDPVEALTLLRGDWHCGYDPYLHRVGPQCTPLATNAPHAVGLAHAARLRGDDVAVLVFVGDGATSEGDAHEAFNFAAVYRAPVVFVVQNNQWAISVPLAKQSKAPTLAHKAIGYGIPGYHIDGNDAAAMYAVVSQALADARSGLGPSIVEGLTYRMDAHTNADDAGRYRSADEVERWRDKDPIERVERMLLAHDQLDQAGIDQVTAAAEEFAADVRTHMREEPVLDPGELFDHVYAEQTAELRAQRAMLLDELAAAEEGA